jgi:hypothetical protein
MTVPWRGYFHCIGNTYGSWLPGDPRGFRTKHHREHVDGDYRNPPPAGRYERLHQRSQGLMKRTQVRFTDEMRRLVIDIIVQSLRYHGVGLVVACVSSKHAHALASFEPGSLTSTGRGIIDPPRHYFGIARRRAARALSDAGLVAPGGVWSRKSEIVPIVDESHLRNATQYILDHEYEGAAVWRRENLVL